MIDPNAKATVHIWDVGQANSCLIDFGLGRLAVVDCGVSVPGGTNPCFEAVVERISSNPQTRIVFILLTHLDWDHYSGLADFVRNPAVDERIERVYANFANERLLLELLRHLPKRTPGWSASSVTRKRLDSLVDLSRLARSGRLATITAGPNGEPTALEHDLGSQCHLRVYSPGLRLAHSLVPDGLLTSESLDTVDFDALCAEASTPSRFDWNAASVVAKLEFLGHAILFTGDANSKTWTEILSRPSEHVKDLASSVVVAWHHGARLGDVGSSDLDQTVWRTCLADEESRVIFSHSYSNPYGHPHAETVQAARDCGAIVHCTQRSKHAHGAAVFQVLADSGLDVPEALLLTLSQDVVSAVAFEGEQTRCCGNISITIDASGIQVEGQQGRPAVCCEPPT